MFSWLCGMCLVLWDIFCCLLQVQLTQFVSRAGRTTTTTVIWWSSTSTAGAWPGPSVSRWGRTWSRSTVRRNRTWSPASSAAVSSQLQNHHLSFTVVIELVLGMRKKMTLQCTLTKQSELYYVERNVFINNSISHHDSSTCTDCL